MFKKRNVELDGSAENALNKDGGNKKKVVLLFGAVAILLAGYLIGKSSGNSHLADVQEAGKSAMGVIKELQNKNLELTNETKRLQMMLVERSNKERELASAFETAISIKEALGVISRRVDSVKENAKRIKNSYINENPEARNLDSKVIRELLNVVDNDTNKQLATLSQAIKTLTTYQKNVETKIDPSMQQDVQEQPEKGQVTEQDNPNTLQNQFLRNNQEAKPPRPVVIQKDVKTTEEIEPLDFNGNFH